MDYLDTFQSSKSFQNLDNEVSGLKLPEVSGISFRVLQKSRFTSFRSLWRNRKFVHHFHQENWMKTSFLEDNVVHLLLDLVESTHQSRARNRSCFCQDVCGMWTESFIHQLLPCRISALRETIFWWISFLARSSLVFPCIKQNLRTRELLPRASSTLLSRRDWLYQQFFSRSEMKYQPARVRPPVSGGGSLLSCVQLNSQLLNYFNVKWLSRAQPVCNTWRVLRLHIWSTFSGCVITWDIAWGSPCKKSKGLHLIHSVVWFATT